MRLRRWSPKDDQSTRLDANREVTMIIANRTTLTRFLIEERRRFPSASGDFNGLMLNVALACKAISRSVALGALGGVLGNADAINVQGETQKKLDVMSNDAFIRINGRGGYLAGMVSEER